MATETQPTGANNILSAFLPQGTSKVKESATASETTKTDLNPDAINEIVRQMMEGDSGLASILKGQVGGGLYNSSTSQLLANDLASRVAGKAALASAPTTVSRSSTGTKRAPSGQVDPKWAAGMKLAEALVGKIFGGAPQTGGANGKDAKANSVFDQIFSGVLGQDKKGQGMDGGFNPIDYTGSGSGGFDLSGMDFNGFGSSGDGGRGESFGGGFNGGFDTGGGGFSGFGNSFDSGFGSGGFDSLSYGLGGGGYNYDPFSLTAGGNYNLGNSYGGGSSGGGSALSGWGDSFSSYGGGGSGNNYSYQPADYSFNSSNFW